MLTPRAVPQTLAEAINYFADPGVAFEYMVKVRWPNGVICPHCGIDRPPMLLKTRRIWKCRECRKQFSVKAGTIFEDSPLGLDKWLPALWMLANCRNGISSYELARDLHVTQKTAWFMLGRIRKAMDIGFDLAPPTALESAEWNAMFAANVIPLNAHVAALRARIAAGEASPLNPNDL